jgi:hypothetical protein
MAGALKIEIQGFSQAIQQAKTYPDKLVKKLDYALEKGVRQIELRANQKKPVDMGGLQVRVDSRLLEKEITVNANYAAFMEFGTGKYAAAYVATLPADWQTYAAQFRGQSGGGSFADMVRNLQEWARRHGMADYKQAGYLIARKIIINGVHPHPFLYPAFFEVQPQLQRDIQDAIDTFAV